MFESIKKKFAEINKENSSKNISFDFKLMFVYHIAMMVLFGARPLKSAEDQIVFALVLSIVLVSVSIVHKVKTGWSWPGLSLMSIPRVLFDLIFLYGFFAFTAYMMNPSVSAPDLQLDSILLFVKESSSVIIQAMSIPIFTPWYLAGIGIGAFNTLSDLNLVSLKKSDFESRCNNS